MMFTNISAFASSSLSRMKGNRNKKIAGESFYERKCKTDLVGHLVVCLKEIFEDKNGTNF